MSLLPELFEEVLDNGRALGDVLIQAEQGVREGLRESRLLEGAPPGYTGEWPDKNGHRRCYQQGHEVECPKKESATAPGPARPEQEKAALEAKKDAADPAHPMNARKAERKMAKFGKDGVGVLSVLGTKASPLSADEHQAMARHHENQATLLAHNGDEAEATTHTRVAKHHADKAAEKAGPAPEQSRAEPKPPPPKPWAVPEGFNPINARGTGKSGPNEALPRASRPQLSLAEAHAAREYTHDQSYRAINQALRAGDEPPGELADVHQRIQDAFARAKAFKAPVKVSRGILFEPGSPELAAFIDRLREAHSTGGVVPIHGYTSTSTGDIHDVYKDQSSVLMSIIAHKGLDLSPYSHTPGERELLLDTGSRFKITKIEKKDWQWHVEMEQVI